MMNKAGKWWSLVGTMVVVCAMVTTLQTGCSDSVESGCGEGCEAGSVCEKDRCVALCNLDSDCNVDAERCLKGLCTGYSAIAGCGNKVREGGEECDDGNANNSDGCLNGCIAATCGDGFVFIGGGEECDNGDLNSDTTSCTTTCKKAVCGDGLVQAGAESCDEGNSNSNSYAAQRHCNGDCSGFAPHCGDGQVDADNETCEADVGAGCPADVSACNDNQACTADTYAGGVQTCDARCVHTPITTCVDTDGCCPEGCTEANDNDCSAVVGLTGKVYRFDTVEQTPQAGVRAKISGGTAGLESDAQGNYSLNGVLAENSTVTVQLEWDQSVDSDVDGNANFDVPASIVTRQLVNTGSDVPVNADLMVVDFSWLAKTAHECGLYGSFADAAGTNSINGDWIISSALVGDLVKADGTKVAGVNKHAISVHLDGTTGDFYNGTLANICFLKEQGDTYIGTTETQSTSAGKFVVLKMSHTATSSLGNGTASIRVLDYDHDVSFGEQSLFLNTANIGYVRLVTSGTMPAVTKRMDFETEVLPIFQADGSGCVNCHQAGVEATSHLIRSVRPAHWGPITVPGDVDDVYNNITVPGTTCPENACEEAGKRYVDNATFPRVCINQVECSLLLRRPAALDPDPDNSEATLHPLVGFGEDSVQYETIEAWIEQGAARRTTQDFMTDVLPVFQTRGCTTGCHQSELSGGDKVIFTGSGQEVYSQLLNGANGALCAGLSPSDESFPYICGDQPLNSRLFRYFFNIESDGHSDSAFTPPAVGDVDADITKVFLWIAEGAEAPQ